MESSVGTSSIQPGWSAHDPCDWTTDEVISFFYTDSVDDDPQMSNSLRSIRSKPSLEKVFREQDISGYILLKEVDKTVLRDDLGVQSFGMRGEIMRVVSLLQRRSEQHRLDCIVAAHHSHISGSAIIPQQPKSPALQRWLTDGSRVGSPADSFHTAAAPSQHPATIRPQDDNLRPSALEMMPFVSNLEASTDHVPIEPQAWPITTHPAHSIAPAGRHANAQILRDTMFRFRGRPDEQTMVDQAGVVRRKLFLIPDTKRTQPMTASIKSENKANDSSELARIKVQIVKPGEAIPRSRTSKLRYRLRRGYLGSKSLSCRAILKGSDSTLRTLVDIGQYVEHPVSISSLNDPSLPMLPFSFISEGLISDGRRTLLSGYIQRFQFHADGVSRIDTLVDRQISRALFRKNKQAIDVPKHHTLPEEADSVGSRSASSEDSSHSDVALDRLAHWALDVDDDDEGLPLYGESDDDESLDSETWEEIQAEIAEKQVAEDVLKPVTDDEVRASIENEIASISTAWLETQLPREERRAFHLWKTANRRHRVAHDIQQFKTEIVKTLEPRMEKLKGAILDQQWDSLKEISALCGALQPTLERKLLLDWQIAILSAPEPPARFPNDRHRVRRTPRPKISRLMENGEWVEDLMCSDSDAAFIIDDLENLSATTPPAFSKDHEQPGSQPDKASIDIQNDSAVLLNDLDDANEDQGPFHADDSEPDPPLSPSFSSVHGMPDTERSQSLDAQETDLSYQPSPALALTATQLDDLVKDSIDLTSTPSRGTRNMPISLTSSPPSAMQSQSSLRDRTRRLQRSLPAYRPLSVDSEDEAECPFAIPEPSDIKSPAQHSKRISPLNVEDLGPVKPMVLKDPLVSPHKRSGEQQITKYDALLEAAIAAMPVPRQRELVSLLWDKKEPRIREALRRYLEGKLPHASPATIAAKSPDRKIADQVEKLAKYYKVWCLGLSIGQVAKPLQLTQMIVSLNKDFDQFWIKIRAYLAPHSMGKLPLSDKQPKKAYVPKAVRERIRKEKEATQLQAQMVRTAHREQINIDEDVFRAADRERVKQQEARRRTLATKLGENRDAPEAPAILVNAAEPFIPLDRRISGFAMEHQIKGIRFLFRELITSGGQYQGCLLAHTMGLGKTMQVVSCLLTIATALTDTTYWRLFPSEWTQMEFFEKNGVKIARRLRILIIAPPVLINNWSDELLFWCPEPISSHLGELRPIQDHSIPARHRMIADWYKEGGVLLISNLKFASIICPATKGQRSTILPEGATLTSQQRARKQLIEGAQIVVLDEAHSIKSPTIKLSRAVALLHTRRRIALTGSPMANHLHEYFRLLDWVAPNYLDYAFREKCRRYIEEGLNEESTAYARKRSLKYLRLLELETAAKVQRAGFKDLKDVDHRLPRKTEFVITVPLSPLQDASYRAFVRGVEMAADTGARQIWTYMTNLLLICNHPWSFHAHRTELDGPQGPENSVGTARRASNHGSLSYSLPGPPQSSASAPALSGSVLQDSKALIAEIFDSSIEQEGVPSVDTAIATALPGELLKQQLTLLEREADLASPKHSNKILVVLEILKAASMSRDKTLVFSQGLKSLEYLSQQLTNASIKWHLMTGATPIALRNANVKEFNDPHHPSMVYLISTTAGGLGLNLQGANRVIILDAKWNPMDEEQAIGRAYRMGQKKPVYIYRMIAGGTIETRLMMQGIFKLNMAARVVDKENPDRSTRRKYEYLFEPEEVPQMDLAEFSDYDPQVLRRIIRDPTSSSWIRKIQLADSFSKPDDEVLTATEQAEVEAARQQMHVFRENPEKKLSFNWELFGVRPPPPVLPPNHYTPIPGATGELPVIRNGQVSQPFHPWPTMEAPTQLPRSTMQAIPTSGPFQPTQFMNAAMPANPVTNPFQPVTHLALPASTSAPVIVPERSGPTDDDHAALLNSSIAHDLTMIPSSPIECEVLSPRNLSDNPRRTALVKRARSASPLTSRRERKSQKMDRQRSG